MEMDYSPQAQEDFFHALNLNDIPFEKYEKRIPDLLAAFIS